MQMYTLDSIQLGAEATKVKNIIIEYLYNNDLITNEVFNDLHLNYGIIIKKPSFFSRLWKGKSMSPKSQYILVRQLNILERDDKLEDSKPKLSVIPLKKDDDKNEDK